jgi:hypothetical protein
MTRPKTEKLLSKVDLSALPAGNHHDGKGLYLAVTTAGSRSWIFRYRFGAKIRHMGLGSLEKVSLPEARAEHRKWLPVLWSKLDPIGERDRAEQERQIAGLKFRDVAAEYLALQSPSWRCEQHAEQQKSVLDRLAYPTLGDLPIAAITKVEILATLQPIWLEITTTAYRLRTLIAGIFDYAISKGYVERNPADWRLLKDALPRRGKVAPVQHFLPRWIIATYLIS